MPVTNPIRGHCCCSERGHSFAISPFILDPVRLRQYPDCLHLLLFQINIRAAPTSPESGASQKTTRYPTIHNGILLVSTSGAYRTEVLSRYTATCPTSTDQKHWSSHRRHSCCPSFARVAAFLALATASFKAAPMEGRFSRHHHSITGTCKQESNVGYTSETMMPFLSASDTIARIAVVARDHLPSSSYIPRILSLSGDGQDNNQSTSPIITESDSMASESRDSLRGWWKIMNDHD